MLTYEKLKVIKTGDNHVHIVDNANNTMITILNCQSIIVDKTNVIIVRNENDSMKLVLNVHQHIEFISSTWFDGKIMFHNNELVVTIQQNCM